MEKIDVDQSNMCTAGKSVPTIIPERLGANDLMHLCHQFRGNMFVIENELTMKKAVDLRQSHDKCEGKKHFQ